MAYEAPDKSEFDAIFNEEAELADLMRSGSTDVPPVEPVEILDETHLVERKYPLPGTVDTPDDDTHVGHSQYVIDRYLGKDPGSLGGVRRVPEVHVVNVPETRGLYFGRRARAAIVAGAIATTLIVNMSSLRSAVEDLGDVTKRGIYDVEQWWKGDPGTHTETFIQPGKVTVDNREFTFESGSLTPDTESVAAFVADIRTSVQNGNDVDMAIGGGASDERRIRASLGRSDPENDVLAMGRRDSLKATLEAELIGVDVDIYPNLAAERLMPDDVIDNLDAVLASNNLTFEQALQLFNRTPDALPEPVLTIFAESIARARTATATVTTKAPDQTQTRDVPNPREQPPVDEERPYDINWYPLLIAGLALTPRIGLRPLVYTRDRKVELPPREPDETWIQLYPEAMVVKPEADPRKVIEDYDEQARGWVTGENDASDDPEHQLVPGAWRYSRKVEILMRDERIKGVLTREFVDQAGERQSLHMMFVDHIPTGTALRILGEELEKMSNIPTGLDGVMIYPEENAGLHGEPKRIGLGIDEQYGSGILGVAIPALGLAEAQMDPNATEEELRRFCSALWTVSHETLGHHSDVIEGLPELTAVEGFPNYYTVKTPWANVAQESFDEFPGLNEEVAVPKPWYKRWFSKPEIASREFELTSSIVDNNGDVIHVVERVRENDPGFAAKIAVARDVTVIGRKPTDYAGTNVSELHAEVAAQVSTGIVIPFSEANITIPNRTGALAEGNFAEGYGVDPVLAKRYADGVGATLGPDGKPYWPPAETRDVTVRYGRIEDDPILGPAARAAKETALPAEKDLITILARTTRMLQR